MVKFANTVKHLARPKVVFVGGGPVGVGFLEILGNLDANKIISLEGGLIKGILSTSDDLIVSTLSSIGKKVFCDLEEVLSVDPDVIFSAGNSHIFKIDTINRVPGGIINFHAAPLPEYKGSACAAYAILNKEKEFGATFHLINEDLDSGPILHVEKFPILERYSSEDLDRNSIESGFNAMVRMGVSLFDGSIKKDFQVCKKRAFRREELEPYRHISLDWDSEDIWRHVRAFDWEGVLEPAYITLPNGNRVYLTKKSKSNRHIN
tara:strand:- start:19437 stop:20225 length:789 start_codon:yes stop_codon:yes gene_type:complete